MQIKTMKSLREEVNTFNSFDDFKKELGFLDIETTGFSVNHHDVTIVGIYSNSNPRTYIRNKNLHNAKEDIENHNYIVTFNGERFDLPFLEQKLDLKRNFKSIDLMYLLWQLGYYGGLKKIENVLGISRPDVLSNLDGKDAVGLWYKYLDGNKEALDTLIKYNQEDITNLEVLLNFVYYKLKEYPVSTQHIKAWKQEINSKLYL